MYKTTQMVPIKGKKRKMVPISSTPYWLSISASRSNQRRMDPSSKKAKQCSVAEALCANGSDEQRNHAFGLHAADVGLIHGR